MRRTGDTRDTALAGEAAADRGAPDPGEAGASMAAGGQGQAGQQMQAEKGAGGPQPGGHLSGPGSPDRSPEGKRASDLEVTLKREELSSPYRLELPSQLVERRTQEVPSQLGYEGTSSARPRPSAEPPPAPVPWEYRDLIRKYFLDRAAEPRKPQGAHSSLLIPHS
jgi:hypothetical protein